MEFSQELSRGCIVWDFHATERSLDLTGGGKKGRQKGFKQRKDISYFTYVKLPLVVLRRMDRRDAGVNLET